MNARNHAPIARALVHLGNRAVLTDHDGVFTFPQVAYTSASFLVMKPGFYPTPNGDAEQTRSYRLPGNAPIELVLYPEAVLSGTVTDPAGEGLNGLSVTAQRSVFDENGHHWYPAGQAQTSSTGEFRLPVPSGSYMLRINQRGRPDSGTQMVMPLQVPALTSTDAEAIKLLPGEDDRLTLRANVRHTYVVGLHFDTDGRGFPSIAARTADGASIPLSPMPSREQGEMKVALPTGSYTLLASMQNQDGLSEAQAQVTVADHDVFGVTMRFLHAANLPVTVEADSSATIDATTKMPEVNQLQLTLQSVGTVAESNGGAVIRPTMRKAGQPSFAVADGVYHLHTLSGGQWYITGATCGGADLLRQDLAVSAGLDGAEVRIRVSNATATLSGKVTVSGVASAAWVYLVASNPSATPVLIVRANSDGSFFRPYLAPGAYRIVALERKLNADLQDNATFSRFLNRLQSVTIAPGEHRTLTLDAVPEPEVSQ